MTEPEGVLQEVPAVGSPRREPFDLTGKPARPVVEGRTEAEQEHWWQTLLGEGQARKAAAATKRKRRYGGQFVDD